MKTYQQAEMDRLTQIERLMRERRIDVLNIQNATPLSNRSLLHLVITKKMIRDAEKVVDDCEMHPAEGAEKLKNLHRNLMYKMAKIFVHEPRLKKICKDIDSELVVSCFTKYTFWELSDDKLDDLKYVIKFCGYNLTHLNVGRYPVSGIMPLINTNCPGLEELVVAFEEIKDDDFKNVFSNMRKLKKLVIFWDCKKSTLPMTLVKSLEEVGGTLKNLHFSYNSKDGVFLPDSLASVFPRLNTLKRLQVCGFRLSQTIIQSISETTSITNLLLLPAHSHPMAMNKINMSPIGNLKNLESLDISWGCGDTDELLINLGNNAKNLEEIRILGINITDNGIFAVKKMSQLKRLYLGLDDFDELKTTNNFITDESIQCLINNEQLRYIDLCNCSKVSNTSVIKLFENLTKLSFLEIENTNVTIKIVEELSKLTKLQKEIVRVKVSFKDCNGIFKSLLASHNIEFETISED